MLPKYPNTSTTTAAPIATARRPVAAPTARLSAPNRTPNRASWTVIAARWPAPTEDVFVGPAIASSSRKTTADANSTAVASAASRDNSSRGRLSGWAMTRSRVPASSSPATARDPKMIIKTAMSTGTSSPNTYEPRYPAGLTMSCMPSAFFSASG